jgi:hypothetical protein
MPPSRAVVRKKRDREDWEHVDLILKDREEQQKESEVYERGEKVSSDRLRRARNRHRPTWVEQQRLKEGEFSFLKFNCEHIVA